AFILVSRSRLHAFPALRCTRQMVQKHAHRRHPGILSGFRINGPVAWHRAALHRVWFLPGDAALSLPHFFQLEKSSSAVARRPPLECVRRFYHLQRSLLRSINFLWTNRRCAKCATSPRESFGAEGCFLVSWIYREVLVLKLLRHCFGLLRLDLFGRSVQELV